MIVKTIFAGFGGQGILLMGYALATAAMTEDKYVTFLPSYGAEVRGGTAHCTVSIADEEIASPIASTLDYLVIMNAPSLSRFQSRVKRGGVCLVNSSLVHQKCRRDDIRVYELPVAEIAEELGDIRVANMVMLGAFVKVSDLVKTETVIEVLPRIFSGKKQEILAMNREGILRGHGAVRGEGNR
jgi:2-oxoglutarate ferredoxin oxidoreductase subunit gamma